VANVTNNSASERTAVILGQHPLWLEALQQLLDRNEIEVLAKTSDAQEALSTLRERDVDVFVVELEYYDGKCDGLSCVRQASEASPALKTVVLSAHEDAQRIDAAFTAGASVYCGKRAAPDDLASAIRQAFEQSIYYAWTGSGPAAATGDQQDLVGLTRREREILTLVAEGHSNAQLAKMLWVTEQTVKFHLSNIYRKLDVSNRTEASRWAQLHGLLPAGSGEVVAA
jgi:DNA-binding NarL/FixJ family response regulator